MDKQYQNTVIEGIDKAGKMDQLLIREVEQDELFEVHRKDYGEYRLGNIQYLSFPEFPGDKADTTHKPHPRTVICVVGWSPTQRLNLTR